MLPILHGKNFDPAHHSLSKIEIDRFAVQSVIQWAAKRRNLSSRCCACFAYRCSYMQLLTDEIALAILKEPTNWVVLAFCSCLASAYMVFVILVSSYDPCY